MKGKFRVVSVILTLILFLFTGMVLRTSTQVDTKILSADKTDDPLNVPIVDFGVEPDRENLTPQEVEERFKRNERYNYRNQVFELPSDLRVRPKSAHWVFEIPALPIKQSDAILIGSVEGGKAFLSTDKTGIYSEFYVSVEALLKPHSTIGQNITVERAGGAVRFPSGKVQRIEVFKGQEMPRTDGKYIFFLRAIDGQKSFRILTAYEIGQNVVKSLDSIAPYNEFDEEPASSFLERVRNEISKGLKTQ